MAVERVLSNLNLISFKTEGGLQNHIDELQDGDLVFTPDNSLKGNLFDFKWTDHALNDMSWLNADTFSWQSGDVYVAAYEHLASEAVFETGTRKYIYVSRKMASGELEPVDKKFYRTPEADYYGEYAYEGFILAWRSDDGFVVSTNTENPNVSDTVYHYGKQDKIPDDPPFEIGRVIEAGEETLYSNAETETVDGIAITFCRAEDGHKIVPANHEADVQALYEKTGVAWYYILDKENKQFKLPRTKFGFTGLRDNVGGYVEAGLPNITGKFGYYLANVGSLGVNTATGAFSGTNAQNLPTATKTGTETTTPNAQVDFKASRSSSVYGNSNTVQPKATQAYLYFYVGNFEREAIEQTAGITAEMFSDKADVSRVQELENKTRHVVVEYQAPSSSNKTTWFRIYSDGWVEQGGTVTGSWSIAAGAEQIPSVTLPIPVSNAHAFFSTREVYCLPMGYYFENNSTVRARFGAYQVARTLTEFKYVVYGTRA